MAAQPNCTCEDAEEIRRLLAEYGRLLDLRDYSAWAALFAPEGEWVGGDAYGTISGRAALADFAEREFAQTPPCMHLFGNMAVTLEGRFATAWSRWMLVEQGESGIGIALAGSYSDRLARLEEGWRFQRREVTVSLPATA